MATPSLSQDNFFTTTLAQDLASNGTTVYLNAVPTATEGYLVLEPDSSTNREIIYYTSKGANYVTCPSAAAGRGVGGTSARAHTTGAAIEMNTVAEHFKALQDGSALAAGSITNAKFSTTAGEPGGAWKDWTPTLANWTAGSGALLAKYTQIGKTVHYYLEWTFGAGAAVGTGPTFTLPVTSGTRNALAKMGDVIMEDANGSDTIGYVANVSPTVGALKYLDVAGTYPAIGAPTASVPFTWGGADKIIIAGTYEAA